MITADYAPVLGPGTDCNPAPVCPHNRLTSTLMWPPEANSIRCEDCGFVLREAWSHLR